AGWTRTAAAASPARRGRRSASRRAASGTPVRGTPTPLSTDKAVARKMLNQLRAKADMASVGLGDPLEEHHKGPLAEHLADYRGELKARDNAPRYVELTISRLEAMLAGCGFAFIRDFDAERASAWLKALRDNGPARKPLPAGQEEFKLKEVAALL